jgi:hypothetical protein
MDLWLLRPWCVMLSIWANPLLGQMGGGGAGWALEISTFLGPTPSHRPINSYYVSAWTGFSVCFYTGEAKQQCREGLKRKFRENHVPSRIVCHLESVLYGTGYEGLGGAQYRTGGHTGHITTVRYILTPPPPVTSFSRNFRFNPSAREKANFWNRPLISAREDM